MEMISSKDEIFHSSPLKQVILPIVIHDVVAEKKREEENLKSIKRMMARLGNRECEGKTCKQIVSSNKRWCRLCYTDVVREHFSEQDAARRAIAEKTA